MTEPPAGAPTPTPVLPAGARTPTPDGSAAAVRLGWWPLVAVALACLLPLPGLWDAPGPPMEEGFMLVFPELVRQGFVPNRDFLHLYGPGSLWVLAAVYELFGTTLGVERTVGFIQQVAVAFAVLFLLRPWGRLVAATGGVVAAVIVVPPIGLTALAWVGGVALGLWSLHLTLRARIGSSASTPVATANSRWLGLGGLLGGFALLYRPDLVLAVGGALLVAGWRLPRPQRRWLAGGLAVGLSPYLVHLVMAGVGNVVDGLFVEPVFDLRGGRRLPLPPSWGSFDGFLQRAGELIEPPWPLPAPGSPAQLTLWLLLLLAAVVTLLVAGIGAARRGDRRLLAMAVFATGMLPQALQRADSTHLAWVTCVPLAFLPAAVAELLTATTRWPARRVAIAAAATPVALTLALVPHFTWRTWGDYVAQGAGLREVAAGVIERGDRRFPYGRLDAVAAVNALIPDLERVSSPGDTLFVGSGDLRKTPYSEAFIYYLFPELPPATRYIEMDPGVANAPDSGLAEELEQADVVVLSSIRDDWDEPNDSRVFGPNAPNEILERDFCLVESYGVGLFGRGLYELYTRCE